MAIIEKEWGGDYMGGKCESLISFLPGKAAQIDEKQIIIGFVCGKKS